MNMFINLLRTMFNPYGRSKKWIRDDAIPLVVDFDKSRICDISIGDPHSSLCKFGKVEVYYESLYEYKDLNITFWLDDDVIDMISIETEPEVSLDNYKLKKNDELMGFTQITSIDKLESFLGKPLQKEQENSSIILTYYTEQDEYQIEFNRGIKSIFFGRINQI